MAATISANLILSAFANSWVYDGTPTGQGTQSPYNATSQVLVTFQQALDSSLAVGTAYTFQPSTGITVSWNNGTTSTATQATVVSNTQLLLQIPPQTAMGYFYTGAGAATQITGVSVSGQPFSQTATINSDSSSGKNVNFAAQNVSNPSALPVVIAFQLTPSLQSYLTSLGYTTLDNMEGAVTISFAASAGTLLWPSQQTGSSANGTAFSGQTINGQPLQFNTNYTLADLAQTIPEGGSGNLGTSLVPSNATWGLQLNNTYSGVSVSLPNILLNDFVGGRIYIGVASSSDPTTANLTYSSTNIAAAPTGNIMGFFEPHVGAQPGVTGYLTDANADVSYVDSYSLPIDLTTYGQNNQPLAAGAQGASYVTSINGGAGSNGQLSTGNAIWNALSASTISGQTNLQGGALISPDKASPGVYHDWSNYWNQIASSTTNTALIVSGGQKTAPTPSGGNSYSFTAHFYNGSTANSAAGGYLILVSNVNTNSSGQASGSGSTYSIYVPFDSKSPQPAASYIPAGFAALNTPSGIYGGNSGYYVYSGDLTASSSIQSALTTNNPVSSSPQIDNTAWGQALGDVLTGLNYGVIGSSTSFTNAGMNISTAQTVGSLMSYQWWYPSSGGSQLGGPITQGIWGPWTQSSEASVTNSNMDNANWNTWLFALNGHVASSPTNYSDYSTYLSAAASPLSPSVYGYAFSDRLGSILEQYNAPGTVPGSTAGYGVGGTIPTGYELVSIGAPGNYAYTTADSVISWFQAVQFRNGDTGTVTSYVNQLNAGTATPLQIQSEIINSQYTQNVVNTVIKEYQAAYSRVPDQDGLQFWVNQYSANQYTQLQLANIFASSQEFSTIYNGATASTPGDTQLVTAFYQNVLQRTPDAAGLAFWIGTGDNAGQLLKAFATCQEFQVNTQAALQSYHQAEILGTAISSGPLFFYQP